MNDKDFDKFCTDLHIIINETLMPLMLKRNWDKYFNEEHLFPQETYTKFDCMHDEIDRLYRLIDNFEKLRSDREIIRSFILWWKEQNGIVDEDGDEFYSLTDSEKDWVELYLKQDDDG